MEDVTACGTVVAGFGVASGRTPDPRFPGGTLALQAPLFRERGVDLASLIGGEPVMGTINLDLAPLRPRVTRPELIVPDVTWSRLMPPENFWLFRAQLGHARRTYPALIYMPDPGTKPEHVQPPSVVEIVAVRVPDLAPGDLALITAGRAFIRFE